jgi:hypothetical protein
MRTIEIILNTINERKAELDILRQTLDNATIKEALQVGFCMKVIASKAIR